MAKLDDAHERGLEMRGFVLRVAVDGNTLREALGSGDLIIGWSESRGLIDDTLDWERFRQIVHDAYYAGDGNYRRSGAAAGNLWRFIREMSCGDLVVVPSPDGAYVARVDGPARYDG